jgi:leader peptidase (prepilin peptidase)/N-methyltransferase
MLLTLVQIDGAPIFANLDIQSSVIGAAAGYLSLWSVYQIFKLITGKEGMGYGDFKLLAALGAWLGWQLLPLVIVLSAAVGSIVGISLILAGQRSRQAEIPFGPYLAGAGWLAALYGRDIMAWYLNLTG